MKLKLYLTAFGLVLFQMLFSQNLSVEYLRCQNCTSTDYNGSGTTTYTYDAAAEFNTIDLVSDYGPRDTGTDHYDWHGGVDYSPETQNNDLGDGIVNIVAGSVHTIDFRGTYKFIYIDGLLYDFGYGHIFTNSSNDQTVGNFHYLEVVGTMPVRHAIITEDNRALSTMAGDLVTHPETGDIIETTDFVFSGQSIAPIGKSATPEAHLHLYAFENDNFNDGDDHTKNPLDLVNHVSPDFDVTIMEMIENVNNHTHTFGNGNTLNHDWNRFEPTTEGLVINYPGNVANEFLVKAQANGLTNGNKYSQGVLNIERVQLFIKNLNLGTPQALIQGPFFNSEIVYDGKINNGEARYPSDLDDDSRGEARMGRTGIECWAYSDRRQRPWDYFNFADFVSRIHTNDVIGAGGTEITDTPQNARYNDGLYEFEAKLKNINDEIYDSGNLEKVLDNFQPFMTQVQFLQNDVARHTLNRLQNEGTDAINDGKITNQPIFNDIKELVGQDITVNVTTSEPMDYLAIEWKNENNSDWNFIGDMDKVDNTSQNFTVKLSPNFDYECYIFRFSGQDLALNDLIDVYTMTDQNGGGSVSIPVRNSTTTWLNEDDNHLTGYDFVRFCIDDEACIPFALDGKEWNTNKSMPTGDCDQLDLIYHTVIYDCDEEAFVIRLEGLEEGDFDIGWSVDGGDYQPGGLEFMGTEPGEYCYLVFNEDECCFLEFCVEITSQEIGSNLEDIIFFFTPGPNGTSNMNIDGSNTPLFNTPIFMQLIDSDGNEVGGPKILSETSTPSPWVGLPIGEQFCIRYEDAGGCTDEYCFTVEGETCPGLLTTELLGLENTCPDENEGSIEIGVVPSDCQFSVSWDNGDSGSSISGLSPGTYCVTVQGTGFCEDCKSVRCFTINEKSEEECIDDPCDDPIVIDAVVTPLRVCNDWEAQVSRILSGSIVYSISGGSGNYDVSVCYVNPFTGVEENLGDLNGFVNVPFNRFGTYCIKITDDCGNEIKECYDFWQIFLPKEIPDCKWTKFGFHGENEDYYVESSEAPLIKDLPYPQNEYAGKSGYWSLVRDTKSASESEFEMVYELQSKSTDYKHMHLIIHNSKGKKSSSNGSNNPTVQSPALKMLDVSVQPNPFAESIQVTIESDVSEDGIIEIFDINGKKVFERNTSLNEGTNIIKLDDLPENIQGALFLKITTNTGSNTLPVIRI